MMKRLLWLSGLVLLACVITACGDDSGGDGSSDDGITVADIDKLRDNFDDLRDDIDAAVGGLDERLDDFGSDLSDRLDTLEDPDVPECSDNELCLPDGIDYVSMGIAGIIEAICNHEMNCCNADELNYKFGPGITDAEECIATFTDLVNNGFAPGFVDGSPVAEHIVRIAAAINADKINVEINAEGVEACIDFLNAEECPQFAEAEPAPTRCSPWEPEPDEYPCDIEDLLIGLQAEGEQCGFFYEVPECIEETVCRAVTEGPGGGICVEKPVVDERCIDDSDCDDDGDYNDELSDHTTLYCKHSSGSCQKLGGKGDPCKPIKASTQDPRHPDTTAEDCMEPYHCDVVVKKCVAPCSKGAFCIPGNGNEDCPEDYVCNVTEIPALVDRGAGICRKATAEGAPCTAGRYDECATYRCNDNPDYEGYPDPLYVCAPPFAEAGDDCPGGVANATDLACLSRYCDGNTKCVTPCTQNEGGCGDGEFCNADMYLNGEEYACSPLIADSSACGSELGQDGRSGSCASGFCNEGNSTCEAKSAASAACASGQHEQCPSTQYCNEGSCTDFVATDGDCSGGGTSACGPGAYCNTSNLCKSFAEAGDDCDLGADVQCESGLSCADIEDGDVCHEPGDFPLGAFCETCATNAAGDDFCGEDLCTSGWCPGPYDRCKAPLAEHADCIFYMNEFNRCAGNRFCDFLDVSPDDPDYGKGTCEDQHTVGEPCDPRFEGTDCLHGFGCQLQNDRYLCSSASIPNETLLCDGE